MIFLNGEVRLEILEKDGGKLVIILLLVVNGWGQWVNLEVRMGGKYDVEEVKKEKTEWEMGGWFEILGN